MSRPDPWLIAGDDPRLRLLTAMREEAVRYPGVPLPSSAQTAILLHALADHTMMVDAVLFDPDPTHAPEATSVGRWMHALGDEFDKRRQNFVDFMHGDPEALNRD